jgi:hypothetical protein
MEKKLSVRETENKVFRTTFQDGLIDIGAGSLFLNFVVAPFLSTSIGDFWSSAVFVPFWLALYLILRTARKRIVEPRLGKVRFGPYRTSRLMRFNLVMLIFLMIALGLGALSFVQIESIPGWVHSARLSLVTLIIFVGAAIYLDVLRFAIYGLLVAAAPLVGELLYQYLGASHHGFPITFGFASAVMILTGLTLFVRLLLRYPRTDGPQDMQGIFE